MEQFRHIGEVLGSLKALMVFQDDIQINLRQCHFLLESLTLAYETIADEMRSNLTFEEKPNKWKVLEQPLKELCKIFREVEVYIRNCFQSRDWWAKALISCRNRDSVEFHIHNLLSITNGMIPGFSSGNSASSTWYLPISAAELIKSCSILTCAKDCQVRRRLGNGGQYKEISWLGERFVLRHIKGEIESLIPAISQLFSLSHPNILHILCGFGDDQKNECFLGELKPSNILVKVRSSSSEGFVHVKVAGFGLPSATSPSPQKSSTNEALAFIWHAPEVLAQQEESKCTTNVMNTEKSDVYSFSMICFELLTGKVPFEDGHLQGDKTGRNIRAGERPLFPFHCHKYMANLTRRCWHDDPHHRPSFSSICRILRYIKRHLVMYPDQSQPDNPIPLNDYCDLEMGLLKKLPSWIRNDPFPQNLEVMELHYPEKTLQAQQMILFYLL